MRPEAFAPVVLPAPTLGPPPAPRVPRPVRFALPNGLRVVAAPMAAVPQVVVRIALRAGSVFDPPEYPGAASLVGALLAEGTAHRTADELNARLDLLGAAVHASVGHDFAEVEGLFLSETLADGLALMAEVVSAPSFPHDETERVRAESLDAIIARLDEPANVAEDHVALETFGADHPYGVPAFGTPEGIESVPVDVLREFHAAHYLPAGSFLIAAGDFDPAELRQLLEQAFAGWTGDARTAVYPPMPEAPARAGRIVVEEWDDAAQSEIRFGGIGLDRRSPQWAAAAVANYILGGSTITGRLGSNLREDKGWTYGARSSFIPGMAGGSWIAETAVDVDVTAAAVAEIRREMQRLVDEPVPADELRRAKDSLVLSLPRAFETPSRVASRLGTLEAYGLPHDYWQAHPARIEAVTVDEVQAMARLFFDPARVVAVVVGGGVEGDA
jgi:zinc protease